MGLRGGGARGSSCLWLLRSGRVQALQLLLVTAALLKSLNNVSKALQLVLVTAALLKILNDVYKALQLLLVC